MARADYGTSLPKLNKRIRLPRLGIEVRIDSPDVNLPGIDDAVSLQLPLIYPPFRSVEEVIIWNQIQHFNPYWQPMVPLFGGPGVRGGTEVDFYNGILRYAVYADGPPHLIGGASEIDKLLRKSVQSLGLKVLSYRYRTPEEVISGFAGWYRDNIG